MTINNFNLFGKHIHQMNNVFDFIEHLVAKRYCNGLYFWLPYGMLMRNRIEKIIREEQNKIGGMEVQANSLVSSQLFEKSSRLSIFGSEVFKIKDRNDKLMLLGPTCEELFMETLMDNKRSYKTLPMYFYQIGTKYRDEIRPRNSLIRTKEFIMKDGYYFCTSAEKLKDFYELLKNSYKNIFNRLKIPYIILEAEADQMLGDSSEEFVVPSNIKEVEVKDANNNIVSGMEIAHIFNLGTKYSEVNECFYLDAENKQQKIYNGSYGIGINRIVTKLIEDYIEGKESFELFRYGIITRSLDDNLAKEYLKLNSQMKDSILIDYSFNNKYEDRILSLQKLGIRNIITEENYEFILTDNITKEKKILNIEKVKEILSTI